MEKCPHCKLEQEPKLQWYHQEDAKTRLYFEKPKKLNLFGIFFGSATLVLILIRLFLLAYAQANNGDTPVNPILGFEVIIGAIGISILFCIGLLFYREFSYPRKLRRFEDMKKKSTQQYVCRRCGRSWDTTSDSNNEISGA